MTAATTPVQPSASASLSTASVAQAAAPFEWPFQDCFTSRSVKHVENIPPTVVPSIDPNVAWGDDVREALLIPICTKGEDLVSAVLVMG
jgi:hypothetical protein